MCAGNFAALLETNIKRMLAYSSIAHAGYVLLALSAHSDTGTAAAMFYLASYAFMNVGAFSAVSVLTGKGERFQSIDVFKAALDSHLYWLTVLGLLNSAVAAYYYLRILVVMYMHEPGEATESAEP